MGIPKRQLGVFIEQGPQGTRERHTFTCRHCQRIVAISSGQDASDMGGGCRRCNSLICGPCVAKGTCTPYEEQAVALARRIEANRSREALHRSIERA